MTSDLIFLILSLFTWGIGEGMFMYFQPLYLQQWGADPRMIGIVYSAFGVSMMITQIPAGILADKIGARPIMRFSWVLGLIACLVMAMAGSVGLYIFGMIFYGFTAFGVTPMNSYITRARGTLSAERALTLVSAGFNSGAVLGPILGGLIAQQAGIRHIYLIACGIFIVSTTLIFFIRKQAAITDDEKLGKPHLHQNPRFLALLPLVFLTVFALYLPQPLIPNYLQNQKGLDLAQIGQLGAIGNLGNALIVLGLGRFNSILGYLLGQGLVILSMVALLKGTNTIWYGSGYFLLGGYRLTRIMLVAYARSLVHVADIGRAFGYLETVNGIAVILAPIISGYLYEYSPERMFSAALILVATFLLVNLYFISYRWRMNR